MITELLNSYSKQKLLIMGSVQFYLRDKNIPLFDRWEIFRKTPLELLNNDTYNVSFDCEKLLHGGEISWYDDFYKDRHSTVEMVSIIESCEENPDQYSEEFITAFKEEILQKCLGSFVHDW